MVSTTKFPDGYSNSTILEVDIVGSTKQLSECQNGDDIDAFAMSANATLSQAGRYINGNNGTVLKSYGDSVVGSFKRREDAIRTAFACTKGLKTAGPSVGHRRLELKFGFGEGPVYYNQKCGFFDGPAVWEAGRKGDPWDVEGIVRKRFPDTKNISILEKTLFADIDPTEEIVPLLGMLPGELYTGSVSIVTVNSKKIRNSLRDGIDDRDYIADFYETMREIAEGCGGVFDRLGSRVKIRFGKKERQEYLAVRAAERIKKAFGDDVTIAVTSGNALVAPVVGTTEIGESVNTAFRLLERYAHKPVIIIDRSTMTAAPYIDAVEKVHRLRGLGKRSYFVVKRFVDAPPEVVTKTKLVGMNKELKKLYTGLRKSGYFATVIGDAGSGKSRLVYEATKKRKNISRYVCSVGDRPFQPLITVLKKIKPGIQDEIEQIYRDHDVAAAKEAVHEKIGRAIASFNGVFVVEDVQYSDQDTLDALKKLSKRRLNSKILLTYRTEGDTLLPDFGGEFIKTQPLSKSDARLLVEGVPFRADLYKASGGNPLLLIGLHEGIEGSGSAAEKVKRIAASRLGRLGTVSYESARDLSVLGTRFSADLAEMAFPFTNLSVLEKVGVIERDNGECLFGDVHQEVLYGSIPQRRKTRLHCRVIDALEKTRGIEFPESDVLYQKFVSDTINTQDADTCSMLASHALKSGDMQRIYLYALVGGGKALFTGDTKSALRFYSDALDAVQKSSGWRNWQEDDYSDEAWNGWRYATALLSRVAEIHFDAKNFRALSSACKKMREASEPFFGRSKIHVPKRHRGRLAGIEWDYYNKMGICKLAINRYGEAEEYYRKALGAAACYGFKIGQIAAIQNLCYISEAKGRTAETAGKNKLAKKFYVYALKKLKSADKLISDIDTKRDDPIPSLIKNCERMARVYCRLFELGENCYTDACDYAERHISLVRKHASRKVRIKNLIDAELLLAGVYSAGGVKYGMAFSHAESAIGRAARRKDIYDMAECLCVLGVCYCREGCAESNAELMDSGISYLEKALYIMEGAGNVYGIKWDIMRYMRKYRKLKASMK